MINFSLPFFLLFIIATIGVEAQRCEFTFAFQSAQVLIFQGITIGDGDTRAMEIGPAITESTGILASTPEDGTILEDLIMLGVMREVRTIGDEDDKIFL